MATTEKVPMSFFDLPPEIRTRIYHHLFKGIVVPAIVATSSSIDPDVRRDRTMGLNMLLASKQCLSEAKPILFAGATFYFDLGDCGRTPGHMKTSLSPDDLYQVRRIKYLLGCTCSLPCGRCFLCAESFTKTPQLSGIEITNNETPIDARDVVKINKKQLLRIFKELFESWPEDHESCLHKDVFQYMRQKASGGQAAELVLKFAADFKDGLGYICVEIRSLTAWAEATGTSGVGTKFVLPEFASISELEDLLDWSSSMTAGDCLPTTKTVQ
ncbi:hypothetical protein LTR67_010745 [Exophiala xenobiotica]